MKLTDHEKDILDGREGPAAQIALSSLVDLGEAFGAEELIAVLNCRISPVGTVDEPSESPWLGGVLGLYESCGIWLD